jgi:hypothetical protein
MLFQARVVGGFLAGDGFDQRDELLAQFGEDFAHAGGFHAVIGEVNQRVGDVVVTGEEVCQLAALLKGFFEQGLHGFEVVGRTGFGPGLVRERGMFVEFGHEGGRDFGGLVVLAARGADDSRVVIVVEQAFGVGVQGRRAVCRPPGR